MFALNGKHAGQTRYSLTFLTVYVTRTKYKYCLLKSLK